LASFRIKSLNDFSVEQTLGLQHWPKVKGYLMDTCLTAQDAFRPLLRKFRL
jgi:hypothetical protein